MLIVSVCLSATSIEPSLAASTASPQVIMHTKKNDAGPPTFIRISPEQAKKIDQQKLQQATGTKKDLVCTIISCGPIICVPGCDPPNEQGTVTGCSSCYYSYQDCIVECK
jgi:hypothetical protein